MHINPIKFVKASAQFITKLNKCFNRRRKRHCLDKVTQSHHLPKHASEYMYSTAFEALIDFLYLTKQN